MSAFLKFHKPFSLLRQSHPPISLIIPVPKRRRLVQVRSCSNASAAKDEKQNPSLKSELWLYNTMSRKKELFNPKVPGKVGMYVCGVTAYDLSHIGHARVYVSFDVLYSSLAVGLGYEAIRNFLSNYVALFKLMKPYHSAEDFTLRARADSIDYRVINAALHAIFLVNKGRYLKYLDYDVCYVRNFTDVDDKIIARAKQLGEDPLSLSRRYCEEFHKDMSFLRCLPPSVEPRVSDHMPQIISMINKILENGCAYIIDGDVYFSVDKSPEYGRLSGRKLEDNRAGERVAVDSRKKNPADFALWKSAKEGETFWDSPWGPGRPGWHIECSAMSAAYLGYSFDIHGGGMDLVFPHHENEIAQSCAACKNSDISYWLHNGFVTIDSEKMSKSLGNFFTIRQVIEHYHPLALRLFLINTHYRSPINYSDLQLESASDRIYYIYQTLNDCTDFLKEHDDEVQKKAIPDDILSCINKFDNDFTASMSNDLHTSDVLAALYDPMRIINDLLNTRKGKKQALRVESIAALEKSIREVLTILGLMPTSYFEALQELRQKALHRLNLTEDEVLQKIEERTSARNNKDYERSDAIRQQLAEKGIALMDNPDGTTWKPALPPSLQNTPVPST